MPVPDLWRVGSKGAKTILTWPPKGSPIVNYPWARALSRDCEPGEPIPERFLFLILRGNSKIEGNSNHDSGVAVAFR